MLFLLAVCSGMTCVGAPSNKFFCMGDVVVKSKICGMGNGAGKCHEQQEKCPLVVARIPKSGCRHCGDIHIGKRVARCGCKLCPRCTDVVQPKQRKSDVAKRQATSFVNMKRKCDRLYRIHSNAGFRRCFRRYKIRRRCLRHLVARALRGNDDASSDENPNPWRGLYAQNKEFRTALALSDTDTSSDSHSSRDYSNLDRWWGASSSTEDEDDSDSPDDSYGSYPDAVAKHRKQAEEDRIRRQHRKLQRKDDEGPKRRYCSQAEIRQEIEEHKLHTRRMRERMRRSLQNDCSPRKDIVVDDNHQTLDETMCMTKAAR